MGVCNVFAQLVHAETKGYFLVSYKCVSKNKAGCKPENDQLQTHEYNILFEFGRCEMEGTGH